MCDEHFLLKYSQIAITATDLKRAMDNLVKPNENEARGNENVLFCCFVLALTYRYIR